MQFNLFQIATIDTSAKGKASKGKARKAYRLKTKP